MKYTEKRRFGRERTTKRDLRLFRPLSGFDPTTIKLLKILNIRDQQIDIGDDIMLSFVNATKCLHVISVYDNELLCIIGDQIGILQEKVRQLYLVGDKVMKKYSYRRLSYPFKLIKILRSKEINSILKAKILQSNI